jgi:hypothetical protein
MNIYYSDNDGWYPVADDANIAGCLVPKLLKKIPECETVKTGHGKMFAIEVKASPAAVTVDTGGWGFDNRSTSDTWGDLWVDCTHTDLSRQRWTSY